MPPRHPVKLQKIRLAVGNPSVPLFSDDGQVDPVVKRPVQAHAGDVWQIPRIKLQVAAGPQQSSIVSTSSGRLCLVSGTVFVLSVGQAIPPAHVAKADAASVVPTRKKAEPPIPELRPCVAPACTGIHRSALGATRVAWSLSLEHTGYHQLTRAELPRLIIVRRSLSQDRTNSCLSSIPIVWSIAMCSTDLKIMLT